MSKFLGLQFNKWHGVIAAFIMVLSLTVLPLIFNSPLQLEYILSVVVGTVVILMLQGTNESFQANSKTLIEDYGSLENFQKNSTDDWKWTMLGAGTGVFIGTLVFILIEKLF